MTNLQHTPAHRRSRRGSAAWKSRTALLALMLAGGCSPKPATLEQRARNGDPAAQHELGERLLFGKGVPENPEEAVRWIRRAAANGSAAAAVQVGRLHLGEPRDPVEACAWFLHASRSRAAAAREDALKELDALSGELSPEQRQQAEARAAAIATGIAREIGRAHV